MNLTITQAYHRTQNLGGEIKAAESALTDCEADAKAKERIASIAAEAVEKAKGHLETLRQEREELAEHMAALVRKTGEALELPEPESPFWRGDLQGSDFQAQAIANGLARIGEIVDEARAP